MEEALDLSSDRLLVDDDDDFKIYGHQNDRARSISCADIFETRGRNYVDGLRARESFR